MTDAAAFQIAPARWPEDADLVRTLLSNYGEYLASTAVGSAGVCLIGYEAELRALPGKYADILLARVNGEGSGCVALTRRVLGDGTSAVEMKRLWVEVGVRGVGVGRGLVNAAIAWAQEQRCGSLVLDTVNHAMPGAARLYRSLGFVETGRFNDNPVPRVRFYRLELR